MSTRRELRKKELNQLLTLGTAMLSRKDLIDFAEDLRARYKINLTEKEWNPEYREKLKKNGTLAAIKEEVEEYFAKDLADDEDAPQLGREISKIFRATKNEKAKDHFEEVWQLLTDIYKQKAKNYIGDLTVGEVIRKMGLEVLTGDFSNDVFLEYVITDDFKAFPKKYHGAVMEQGEDVIVAIATPLTIQELILDDFKKAMRKKFPDSFQNVDDCVAAASLAYKNRGWTNKQIAAKLYDINPSRKDYEAELKRKENLVTKKIKKINEQLDMRSLKK